MRLGPLGVSLAIALAASPVLAAERERSLARLELAVSDETQSCIDQPALEKAVERRLKRKVFREPAELLVKVRFARTESGWSAELVLSDDQQRELGRRALDTAAADCSALDASLALVVALLVDSPPEPPPPPAPTVEAPLEPKPVPPEPAPAPPTTRIELPKDTFAPREPWRFVPTASFSVALDRLPGFAFGPRVGVALLPPHFPEVRASVGALLPQEHSAESEGVGGRFWLVDAALELCPLAHRSMTVRISGCFGQSVGRLSVEGFGFDENSAEPGVDLVVTAGLSSFFLVAPPFGLLLGLGAGLPLSRNAYFASGPDGERVEVWQRGYVVGTGEVGVGLEF